MVKGVNETFLRNEVVPEGDDDMVKDDMVNENECELFEDGSFRDERGGGVLMMCLMGFDSVRL
jgi:hypothetical protein